MSGPLEGVRAVEFAGVGPGPFCGMLLADLGADVVRLEREDNQPPWIPWSRELLNRGKRSVAADLKTAEGRDLALRLVAEADLAFEGFRPGVAERLGVGPEDCLAANPKLVYGRMTGWGQDGPLAATAGHDITYIARTGALHAIGPHDGPPSIPLNLVGDFGGGSLYLAVGMLAALESARRTGTGQVVDAAMVDGASHLMTMLYGFLGAGAWNDERESNTIDGGAPFYGLYRTKDDRYMAIGPFENKFFRQLIETLGIDEDVDQWDQDSWPRTRRLLEEAFCTRTRDEWAAIFDDTDCCVSPVLTMSEAPDSDHLLSRQTFVDHLGVRQPAPSPRFSGTPAALGRPPSTPGEHTAEVLREWLR
jgi:alpha-methylacyl-CoA racemase